MKGLNLCCGKNKLPDCDNVDFNGDFSPDLCFDIRSRFPLESQTYDEVYLFHSIEHVEGKYHRAIFAEVHRVLKQGGVFYVSYPEFKHIAQFWIDNYKGMRDFWKDTIYGRQETLLDFHVYPMDSAEVMEQLREIGFIGIEYKTESPDVFNSIVRCNAGTPWLGYENVLQNELDKTSVNLGVSVVDSVELSGHVG